MDQNTIAVLQIIAAFLQVVVACIALPITAIIAIKSAREGARQAYELGESSARDREAREIIKQIQQQQEQTKSLRLLLGLEIQRNLEDLKWLDSNLKDMLGEENIRYYSTEDPTINDDDKFFWLEARRRFIALYMPDWSHRVWHNQQSSYLLPTALNLTEVRDTNYIHSQFDRLTKIRDMLAERTHKLIAPSSYRQIDNLEERPLFSASFKEDAPGLWSEFNNTITELLALNNPLENTVDEEAITASSRSLVSDNLPTQLVDSRAGLAIESLKE